MCVCVCVFVASTVDFSPQTLFPYVNDSKSSYDSARVGEAVTRNTYLGQWRVEYEHGVGGGAVGDVGCGFGDGRHCGNGLKMDTIPRGMSCAPFTMHHAPTGTSRPFAMVGGLAAVVQDPETGALEAVSGWAVVERHAQ